MIRTGFFFWLTLVCVVLSGVFMSDGCHQSFFMLHMHQPTNGKPAPFFLLERYDRYKGQKNTNATITCLKNRVSNGAGFPFVCTCGLNTRLKFQIETRKIERGIAIMPPVLISTCFIQKAFLGHTSKYVGSVDG